MSDEIARNFITAKQAAAILKVTERQVHHYGVSGKIRTTRAGRRLLYNPEDVEQLAQTLRVDIKPMVVRRDEATERMMRYVEERQEHDQRMLEAQQEFLETQRGLQETQREMRDQLQHIAQRLDQPPPKPSGPNWIIIAVLALSLAIALVVLLIVLRFF